MIFNRALIAFVVTLVVGLAASALAPAVADDAGTGGGSSGSSGSDGTGGGSGMQVDIRAFKLPPPPPDDDGTGGGSGKTVERDDSSSFDSGAPAANAISGRPAGTGGGSGY